MPWVSALQKVYILWPKREEASSLFQTSLYVWLLVLTWCVCDEFIQAISWPPTLGGLCLSDSYCTVWCCLDFQWPSQSEYVAAPLDASLLVFILCTYRVGQTREWSSADRPGLPLSNLRWRHVSSITSPSYHSRDCRSTWYVYYLTSPPPIPAEST